MTGKTHHYELTVQWTGNTGSGTSVTRTTSEMTRSLLTRRNNRYSARLIQRFVVTPADGIRRNCWSPRSQRVISCGTSTCAQKQAQQFLGELNPSVLVVL
jgi:hypothetical protein